MRNKLDLQRATSENIHVFITVMQISFMSFKADEKTYFT